MKAIVLPDTITKIESGAFQDCRMLETITFSKNLVDIGNGAFRNCIALKEVIFPDSLRSIREYAFAYCTNLQHVTFSDGIEDIGQYAFSGCPNVEEVDFPESLRGIHRNAFSYCSKLRNINIRGNTFITADAFDWTECYNNKENWDTESDWYEALYICNRLIKIKSNNFGDFAVKVKEGTLAIACDAFVNEKNLKSVVLPDSIVSIHSSFSYSGITHISIPDSVGGLSSYEFKCCTNLSKVRLPEKMEYIGASAFEDCLNIEHINIPSGLSEIHRNTFRNCSKIRRIEIPNGVRCIENGAFVGLAHGATIILPESIAEIEIGAFQERKKPRPDYNIVFKGTKKQWKNIVGSELAFPYSVECEKNIFSLLFCKQ